VRSPERVAVFFSLLCRISARPKGDYLMLFDCPWAPTKPGTDIISEFITCVRIFIKKAQVSWQLCEMNLLFKLVWAK